MKRTLRRDAVYCGVNTGLPGFSAQDDKGKWSGFDVDFCRAIAAAIFDDPNKVKFVPLDAKERFAELAKRKVDVLARNSTWTMSRETQYALHFAGVSYYDGQGFMVPRARNKTSALELDGSKVCVQGQTTTIVNLADYFRANNMKYEEKSFRTVDEVFKAYAAGQCDVLTSDVSQLYALRLKLAKPADHVILADVISKEPLAPVVRHKDDDWLLLVKWTLFAMIDAEELGITSKNIDEALKSKKPEVMRFVGNDGDYGAELDLPKDWAAAHHPPRRQLRRGLRAQRRHRLEARHSARAQPALERRRHPLRAADPLAARAIAAVRKASACADSRERRIPRVRPR